MKKKIRVVLEIGIHENRMKEEGLEPKDFIGNFLVREDDVVDGLIVTRNEINGLGIDENFFYDGDETFIVSSEVIEAEE